MKLSAVSLLLATSFTLGMPTATIDKGTPSKPEAYGAEQSVSYTPYKRHLPGDPYPGEPEQPSEPYQSVARQAWKRQVQTAEQVAKDVLDGPPLPYQSVSWVPYKRNVEETLPEPEHYEVLTA